LRPGAFTAACGCIASDEQRWLAQNLGAAIGVRSGVDASARRAMRIVAETETETGTGTGTDQ
jgi:hypothetical protein